jgi:hypothetical protein
MRICVDHILDDVGFFPRSIRAGHSFSSHQMSQLIGTVNTSRVLQTGSPATHQFNCSTVF